MRLGFAKEPNCATQRPICLIYRPVMRTLTKLPSKTDDPCLYATIDVVELMLEADGDAFYVSDAVEEEVCLDEHMSTWNNLEMDFLNI